MTSGWQGALFFRKYGGELGLERAVLIKTRLGGYCRTTPLRLRLRLVAAMNVTEPGLHEREGVGRRQSPKICFVRRQVPSVGRGLRDVEAVVHIDGRFNLKPVKVR